MKREIIEYVPREGWETWRRKQKIKNVIVDVITWSFWIILLFVVAYKL